MHARQCHPIGGLDQRVAHGCRVIGQPTLRYGVQLLRRVAYGFGTGRSLCQRIDMTANRRTWILLQ